MGRVMRWSGVPLVAAAAALFSVLPRTGADAEVRMLAAARAWRFSPIDISVSAGQRVAFTNDSTATHTATCSGCRAEAWDTGDVQPGQTRFVTFDDDATYAFLCRYHGRALGMVGRLVVGDGGPPPAASP